MSKVQERGLMEALGEAEGLARVIRAMSDGRLDLQPVTRSQPGGQFTVAHSWEAAKTEARSIAGTLPSSAAHTARTRHPGDGAPVLPEAQPGAETFCSNCGCLDEPGVHPFQDCPRYERAATSRPEGS